jgi:hypothetical protein
MPFSGGDLRPCQTAAASGFQQSLRGAYVLVTSCLLLAFRKRWNTYFHSTVYFGFISKPSSADWPHHLIADWSCFCWWQFSIYCLQFNLCSRFLFTVLISIKVFTNWLIYCKVMLGAHLPILSILCQHCGQCSYYRLWSSFNCTLLSRFSKQEIKIQVLMFGVMW